MIIVLLMIISIRISTILLQVDEVLMILISLQVDEVLSKESEQDLLEGDNPGPMTEIHFWEAK